MAEIIDERLIWRALKEAASDASLRGYVYKDRAISFREMDEWSDRLAAGLLKLGYQKGDRIGIIGLNQPEWIISYFAAAKIGAVVVGLNVRYRESELDYIINHSRARGIITHRKFGDMDYVSFFREFSPRIPSVRDFIFLEGEGFEGSLSFQELMEQDPDGRALQEAKESLNPDDLVLIIYTSGTTGRPKGAAISHGSQLASARAQAEHTRVSQSDVLPVALPLNHVGGITCGILTALLGRATVILVPWFDPAMVLDVSSRYGATVFAGVPTMHVLLLMNEKIKEMDTSKVRLVITGGSNAEPNLLRQLKETFPQATVMNLYGLSESSGALVLSPWDSDFDTTVRSIGKPIDGFRVKVVGADDEELPPGEVGELVFSGDAVARGYFDMPKETAETFRNGWLYTGDMGYLDERGYIYLMGRKKEMFIQGGFNVYPVEVENVLTRHSKVLMAAGIGVPDPVLGEVGRYYIVPRPGEEPTEDEIRDYCRQHLADYKVPRQIVFCKELPLTPAGKVMKSKLKELYEQSMKDPTPGG